MKQENVPYKPDKSQAAHRDRPVTAKQRAAEELLLLCTTDTVSPEREERISRILAQPVDWAYLLNLTTFHGVISLVAHNMMANGLSSQVPAPYLEKLKRGYNTTVYRNVMLSSELTNVLSAFNQRGIKAITLKGTPLAEALYGNPALRMVYDIDILVHRKDITLARMALTELGYKKVAAKEIQNHPFHGAPYYKEGSLPFLLELHWGLEDSQIMDIPEEEIWHRAQTLQLQEFSTPILSPEDNLLFMANHLTKNDYHLLKFLGDIAQLLKKYERALDWQYIINLAHSVQMETAAYYALRRARDLLGAPVPPSSLEALKPGGWRWWLLDLLVSEETFVSPIRWRSLRGWTAILARSLMVSGSHRILAVLSRHNGSDKKAAWFKTAFWITPVLAAGLWRYCTKFATRGAHGLVKHGYNE